MDIKDATEIAEALIEEHMQAAIKSDDAHLAEIRAGWAYGILLMWSEMTFRAIQEERNLSRQNEMRRYRSGADERLSQLADSSRVPLLNSQAPAP